MDKHLKTSHHVLIFPFPAQGHVNSMLKLTELLLSAGIDVTFLISGKNHDRLSRYTTVHSRLNSYRGFRFHTIDGLYEGGLETGEKVMMMVGSCRRVAKPLIRNMLLDSPVSCLIIDGIMGYAMDAAEGTGVPVIIFRTISACAFWAYFCIPQLIEAGELPFSGTNMDNQIANVKGMEGFLRRRDLPSFCRVPDIRSQDLQTIMHETRRTPEAHGLILNTFDDLEGPILSQIRTQCPNVYTIGPLNSHLKARFASKSTSSNSLFEEDRSCIGWLDKQPSKSVLYVSFGSIATLTREQLIEFWHGLVNSEKRFLWVIRKDLVLDNDTKNEITSDLEKITEKRGYMVEWAPQEDVLAHPSIGAFLTHSGWNSTLESIVEGVPMICWSFFADQQVISRYVEAVWKLGLDMKDTCNRSTVKKMVKEVMEVRNDEFMETSNHMAKLAKKAVSKDGSSYCNFNRLVEDIKNKCLTKT